MRFLRRLRRRRRPSESILCAFGNQLLKDDQFTGYTAAKLKAQIIREDHLIYGFCRATEATTALFCAVSRDIIDCIFQHCLIPEMEMITMEAGGEMEILSNSSFSLVTQTSSSKRVRLYDFIFIPKSNFPSARSMVAVKNRPGRYYYEFKVTVLSSLERRNNLAQIGWCDDECTVGEHRGIGDGAHSWAFDGGRVRKWHNNEHEEYGKKWSRIGEVVGCAVRIYEAGGRAVFDMGFYLNNEYLGDAWIKRPFSGHLYPACTFQDGYCLGAMIFSRDDLKFLPAHHEPILF